MNPGKFAVLIAWVLLAAGFVLSPESGLARAARAGFWLMAVAHVVEFVVFRRSFEGAPGSTAGHFVQTLIFGLFHIREFRQAGPSDDSAG